MIDNPTFTVLFDAFKESISNGTFAKLTLAKTIGNTPLMNIYVKTVMVDGQLLLALRFRYQTEEEITNYTIEEAIPVLISYINNPFLTVLLFTTEADVTMKLNKKRNATITEQPATFKNPDPVLLDFLNQSK
ncbi:hypothetical protein [Flavobacterium humi]|uniref:Uncharacterized protein n=1 Tax=Flavobacterium humi TaxID=2562683 RepID=A0A4Z0L6Z3_9FLAO|nr:hypothetical protein [Flavobacterium humi]TGD58011.1 hypothetical protein E4635_08360 [Flavobacterium humi]